MITPHTIAPPTDRDAAQQYRTLLAYLGLAMFALLLREYVVLVTQIGVPIKGDVRDYVAYTQNMLAHGIFSMSTPPVPDAFRSPGYPLYLAACSLLAGDGWYALALHGQAILGAATAVLSMTICRQWLGLLPSLAAGALVAVWPHHVVATVSLLSEVLFGFLLALSLWSSLCALRGGRRAALITGVLFGLAALVNPVAALLPLLPATALWLLRHRKAAGMLLAASFAISAGWALRNAIVVPVNDAPGRVEINFIQGTWPQYHAAAATAHADAHSRDIIRAIDAEYALLHTDTDAGLRSVAARIGSDPSFYARWFLLTKPYLLWEWNIRAGIGDIYFHAPINAPFENHPVLRAIKAALRAANPLLFALAAGYSIAVLASTRRRRAPSALAPWLLAASFVYFTGVHWILQAEPRYAIPYRFIEVSLAVGCVMAIGRRVARRPHTAPFRAEITTHQG